LAGFFAVSLLWFVALQVLFIAMLHWGAVAYNLFAWWFGLLLGCGLLPSGRRVAAPTRAFICTK
jgi:hypothetical protein